MNFKGVCHKWYTFFYIGNATVFSSVKTNIVFYKDIVNKNSTLWLIEPNIIHPTLSERPRMA